MAVDAQLAADRAADVDVAAYPHVVAHVLSEQTYETFYVIAQK